MEKLFKTEGDYVYIHTELGSDLFGDGSIERPYSSLLRAISASVSKQKLLRGVLIENIYSQQQLIGDEPWQTVISSTRVISSRFENIRMNGSDETIIHMYNCISSGQMDTRNLFNSISEKYSYWNPTNVEIANNSTILNGGAGNFYGGVVNNCIIVKSNNVFFSNFLVFRYCVFPSTCEFALNSTAIAGVNYGDDPFENIRILKRTIDPSWSEFGSNQPVDILFGTININEQKFETCQIVKEQKDGGVLPNIFNSYEYDGVTPKDYYLNADPNNVALHASENGEFVGALPPSVVAVTTNQYVNVDPLTGNSTASVGNIITYDEASGIVTNNDPATFAGQTWNRFTSQVVELEKHASFEGVNNYRFASGQTSGLYVGKRQVIFGETLTPANGLLPLLPGKIYKVFDSSESSDQDSGVIVHQDGQVDVVVTRNNILTTPANIANATYTARSANGVTVREVINTPRESIEVFPYDSITDLSAFPPFSCPMNEPVLMIYHKAGGPVLFGDISHDKPAYYNGYAVTNADKEYNALIADAANYEAKKVFLRYCRVETNVLYEESLRVTL